MQLNADKKRYFYRKEVKDIPLFNIFSKNSSGSDSKPTAVAFVDYEHWYISMEKFFGVKPDIRQWRNELNEHYNVTDIMFFADFSNPSLRAEIQKIREVSSYIIETQTASQYHKKDYTDFIMLDHIYQRAMTSENTDVFIIFSGDGHFSSVISFLVNRCGKTVSVYGIKDALSTQLRNTANITVDWPPAETIADLKQKQKQDANSEKKVAVKRKNKSPTEEKILLREEKKKTANNNKSDKKVTSEQKTAQKTTKSKTAVSTEKKSNKNSDKDTSKNDIQAKAPIDTIDLFLNSSASKTSGNVKNQKNVSKTPQKKSENQDQKTVLSECSQSIIKNMRYLEKNNTGNTKISHTVEGTIDSVSSYYKFDRNEVTSAVIQLCELGYLTCSEKKSTISRGKGTLEVNWKKVNDEKII